MTFPKPADYPFWFRLVVVVTLTLFTVNLFFFLAPTLTFFTWAAANISGNTLIGPLVGSFFGASCAFAFANYQRNRERKESEVAAGNRALFTLTQMYNELRQVQKAIVDPYRGRDDAWLNLPVGPPLSENLSFDTKEISFVMRTDAMTFAELFLEERRYRLATFMVKEHTRIALSEAWPRLEAAGIHFGDHHPMEEMKKIVGASTVRRLEVFTNGIIRNIDEDVKSITEAFTKLRATLKSIYPNRGFIDFKPIEVATSNGNPAATPTGGQTGVLGRRSKVTARIR